MSYVVIKQLFDFIRLSKVFVFSDDPRERGGNTQQCAWVSRLGIEMQLILWHGPDYQLGLSR